MIVTEEQALEMRCCGPEGCGVKMVGPAAEANSPGPRYCIGSRCMGWRQEDQIETSDNVGSNWYRWRYIDSQDPRKRGSVRTGRGRCGLAGQA